MNQLQLFGGGGGDRKAAKAEYDRKRREERRKSNICLDCHAPKVPGKSRCAVCLEKDSNRIANNKARLIADGKCCSCGKSPIAESSRLECVSCLGRRAEYANARRSTDGGRWLNLVGGQTRLVANGIRKSSPKHFNWTHDDFCVRFIDWKSGGDARCIDHIIHKRCAVGIDGERDLEFGALAFDLPNLQLLSSSANTRKGGDLDPIVLTRSNQLRSQGIHGAELFHRLWDEFSEAAQAYGDQSE